MAEHTVKTVSIVKHALGKGGEGQDIRIELCFHGVKELVEPGEKHPTRETREVTLQLGALTDDQKADVHDMMDQFADHMAAWLASFETGGSFETDKLGRLGDLTAALFATPALAGWGYTGLLLDGNRVSPANEWELVFHAKKLLAKSRLLQVRAAVEKETFLTAA